MAGLRRRASRTLDEACGLIEDELSALTGIGRLLQSRHDQDIPQVFRAAAWAGRVQPVLSHLYRAGAGWQFTGRVIRTTRRDAAGIMRADGSAGAVSPSASRVEYQTGDRPS